MGARKFGKREFFEIGLDDLDGLPVSPDFVEAYCRLRRIVVTGLDQNTNFLDVVGCGKPMFERVEPKIRKKCEKLAEKMLQEAKNCRIIPARSL